MALLSLNNIESGNIGNSLGFVEPVLPLEVFGPQDGGVADFETVHAEVVHKRNLRLVLDG